EQNSSENFDDKKPLLSDEVIEQSYGFLSYIKNRLEQKLEEKLENSLLKELLTKVRKQAKLSKGFSTYYSKEPGEVEIVFRPLSQDSQNLIPNLVQLTKIHITGQKQSSLTAIFVVVPVIQQQYIH
ncbi:9391_t:CDS:2, partial [Racocetra fulgida]